MHKIKDLKAGDFIDLDNWFREIIEEDYTNLANFYLPLIDSENEPIEEVMEQFVSQMADIKETYIWIFNPPQMPTDAEQRQPTAGDSYRQEFSEDYGLYTEIIYLLCISFGFKPNDVLQMKCEDFLYWGEYAIRKRIVENIK